MPEIINMGSIKLRFLQSKGETAGSIDMFEMTLAPDARMPVPHYHESWDEAIYGVTGTSTWLVDGKNIDVVPGESLFIQRGVTHGFANNGLSPSTCLCILTPGALGTQYFREMAALLATGTPDQAMLKETMLRYGLIPVAPS